jgi:iron donor protein CyaY
MSFSQNYDNTIRTLEEKLSDLIDNGSDLDLERKGDVLNIELADGEKIVITPQAPLEQLWVSADYAGHRFVWSDGDWTKEKTGQGLFDFMSRTLSTHLGQFIEL